MKYSVSKESLELAFLYRHLNRLNVTKKAFEAGVVGSPTVVKQCGCSVDIPSSMKTNASTVVQGFI